MDIQYDGYRLDEQVRLLSTGDDSFQVVNWYTLNPRPIYVLGKMSRLPIRLH